MFYDFFVVYTFIFALVSVQLLLGTLLKLTVEMVGLQYFLFTYKIKTVTLHNMNQVFDSRLNIVAVGTNIFIFVVA